MCRAHCVQELQLWCWLCCYRAPEHCQAKAPTGTRVGGSPQLCSPGAEAVPLRRWRHLKVATPDAEADLCIDQGEKVFHILLLGLSVIIVFTVVLSFFCTHSGQWLSRSVTSSLGGAVDPQVPKPSPLYTSTAPHRSLFVQRFGDCKSHSLAAAPASPSPASHSTVYSLRRRSHEPSSEEQRFAPHTAGCTHEPPTLAQCDSRC